MVPTGTVTLTQTAGPTSLRERALGPDLARGFMLLFIALANTHYFLAGSSVLGASRRTPRGSTGS